MRSRGAHPSPAHPTPAKQGSGAGEQGVGGPKQAIICERSIYKVLFDKEKAFVYDSNGNGFTCHWGPDRLYGFNNAKLTASDGPPVQVFMSNTKLTDLQTWHRRLAHCDTDKILQMWELVDGLEITSRKQNGKCDDCIRGKSTAAPHDRPIANKDNKNEGLVCTDLWGPSPVHSRGGALYMMSIIDAEHWVKEVYFTPNKEAPTTLAAFDKYRRLYETQTSKKIRQVWFDNEFAVPKEWVDYCNEHGICIEPMIPYSSQMNGISEHTIHTLTDDIRTLLIESGLPKNFWAEAAAYSVYTQNLIPSNAIPGKIPLEGWTKTGSL